CSVFWLPDTFGYSAQLPQIVKSAGLKYFFTQKLSWNNINRFPNTTFNWVGLDGTPVLTHFSPADTYTAQASVRDISFMVKNNKDKEYTNTSLLVYGNGDGGGGPLKAMLERIDRMQNVKGFPASVKHGDPNEFYERLEKNSRDMVSWKGELYFELHRGTYTSQAKTKKYNRTCEGLLQTVEALSAIYLVHGKMMSGFNYSKKEMDKMWKYVLLNQFHDVLPGSCIGLAYEDATKFHEEVIKSSSEFRDNAFSAIVSSLFTQKGGNDALIVYNPRPWLRKSVLVELGVVDVMKRGIKLDLVDVQYNSTGEKLLAIAENLPGYGFKSFSIEEFSAAVCPIQVRTTKRADLGVISEDEDYVLVTPLTTLTKQFPEELVIIETQYFKASFDWHGRLVSLIDVLSDNREIIPNNEKGNVFKMFEDVPLYWDAWDVEVYHLEKGWDVPVGDMVVEEYGPLRVVLVVLHQITNLSTISQRIVISAVSPVIEFDTTVEWHENRRLLKVEFPVEIMCDYATYETQFGYIQRPTHYNTSWDLARFEVCAHKFVDFSEHGYGVALLND
ncbi:Alpha-mannosidase 2C1, partial [Nowakowskiella sp. JEL0078]